MIEIFADLHVHVGRAGGHPVKITASRDLTLDGIVRGAAQKGLKMVGIADAACSPVLREIQEYLRAGLWSENQGGGFLAQGVTVIPGAEVETAEGVHTLSLFPGLEETVSFSEWLSRQVSNNCLSTQRARVVASHILAVTHSLGGLFGFAHAFTPHKGVYGCLTSNLAREMGEAAADVDFVELGLSADARMALRVSECARYPFLSNSDAHSPGNIAREYNVLSLASPCFGDLALALKGAEGRMVIANCGMPPELGKYHRTWCPHCDLIAFEEPPVTACPRCGRTDIVMGVLDRLVQIADCQAPAEEREYRYRVPLTMLPHVGPRTVEKILAACGSELAVLETADMDEIRKAAGEKAALSIERLREQRFTLIPGGGGRYGKIAAH